MAPLCLSFHLIPSSASSMGVCPCAAAPQKILFQHGVRPELLDICLAACGTTSSFSALGAHSAVSLSACLSFFTSPTFFPFFQYAILEAPQPWLLGQLEPAGRTSLCHRAKPQPLFIEATPAALPCQELVTDT